MHSQLTRTRLHLRATSQPPKNTATLKSMKQFAKERRALLDDNTDALRRFWKRAQAASERAREEHKDLLADLAQTLQDIAKEEWFLTAHMGEKLADKARGTPPGEE